MYTVDFEGIRFVEGMPPGARALCPVDVRIGGVTQSAQLKTLDDVKRLMVARVRAVGGNAVIDFKYGQRSVGMLASIFSRDDVAWYGTGRAAVLT